MTYFKEKLEKLVPGSEVRLFFAGALYKIPEAVEAMTEGNLEMTWGQYSKTAAVDPYMNLIVRPQLLTTPGAINQVESLETYKFLVKRFNDVHKVHIFGAPHVSFYVGAGAKSRLLTPDDFAGKKIRSTGPALNALISALGANPTTMSFGDVPPALQTGVIDGLLTSLGGFVATKDQAPYFSIAGLNGIQGDFYWLGASQQWFKGLSKAQQEFLQDFAANDVIPFQKRINWCNDKRVVDKYKAEKPSDPGVYVMNTEEANAIKNAAGSATADWLKANTPDDANKWVDTFEKEAEKVVAAHPLGTDDLEKTNCADYAEYFTKYTK
jgi:TRAP-type C4-dicarboxylate transport system substrate-binding protein